MGQEEQLRAVIGEAAKGLSMTTWRVELEGTGGLALVLMMKLEDHNAGQERAYLQLRSHDNETLASVVSAWAYEVGTLRDASPLESEMAGLVERLVSGNGFNMPMAVILKRRAEEKRRRLGELRRAADQVPVAMVESAEASTAAAWVDRLAVEVEEKGL